jgi:hypothetical protein
MNQPLYERDFYSWTIEQARALADRNIGQLDWQHLAEELEDLGNRHYDQLSSRLSILIAHLLKWQCQSDQQSNSWRATIREQRRKIERLLRRNPGLKSRWQEALADAWPDALDLAIRETGLDEEIFPQHCPFTAQQLQDPNFWPEK